MLALSIPQGFEKEYESGTDEEQHWTITLDDNGVTATASAAPVDQAPFASYGMPTALRRWLDDIDEQYRRMRLWGVDYEADRQDLWTLPAKYLQQIRARLADSLRYNGFGYTDGREGRIVTLMRRIDEHFEERASIEEARVSERIWGIDTHQELLYHTSTTHNMLEMESLERRYDVARAHLVGLLNVDRHRGDVRMHTRLRFVESRLRILNAQMVEQRIARGLLVTATEVRERVRSAVPRINDVIWDDVLAGFVDEAIHSLSEAQPRRRTRRTRRSP